MHALLLEYPRAIFKHILGRARMVCEVGQCGVDAHRSGSSVAMTLMSNSGRSST